MDEKNYLFVGGTAEAFVKFRMPLVDRLIKRGAKRIHCIYFDNHQGYKIPDDRGGKIVWTDLGGDHIHGLAKDVRPVLSLAHIIRKNPRAVIVAFNAKPIFYLGMLVRLFGREAAALMEGQGIGLAFVEEAGLVARIKRLLFRAGATGFSKWIFLNEHDQKTFTRNRLMDKNSASSCIDGIGVNLTRFSPAEDIEKQWSLKSVGFSGRLIREKGPQIVVETARLVHQQRPDIRFHMAGQRPLHKSAIDPQELESWIKRGHIESIAGYDDIRAFYRKVSVVMLPSYSEGMPAVIMEAQAMGLPCLLNRIPQTVKALEDGVSGYLIPDNDPAVFADHIIRILSDKVLYKGLAFGGRRLAEERFNGQKTSATIAEFIGGE